MEVVGKIESLWRYPVKSMRGEELQEALWGFQASMVTVFTPFGVRQLRKDFHG